MTITSIIARGVCWLAPAPSAYFVAISSMRHLDAPLPVAVIIAVVIEGLGLSCSHLALSFWSHNKHTHRLAQYRLAWGEFWLALGMYVVYFAATLALLAMLELAWVTLLFPVLAAVGVVSLALLEQLAQLRTPVKREKRESHVGQNETAGIPVVQKRGTYQDYLALTKAGNGSGTLTAKEIMRELSVPRSTAYRWLGKQGGNHEKLR